MPSVGRKREGSVVTETPPLARRMPGFDARHATRRARSTRVVVTVVVVLAVVAGAAVYFGRHLLHHSAAPPARPAPPSVPVPRAVSTLATWRLGAPITGAVVVAGAPGSDQLVILGGMTTGGLTASGAFTLDVTDGDLTQVGDLMTTLDGASGAVIGGHDVVFGGTSSSSAPPSAAVQALPAPTATGSSSSATAPPTATALGALPRPLVGATAVTVGTTTYLVGGDTTGGPAPGILATSDGSHFTTVATLPVPVQYPAVAVVGTTLYVFGGTAATGADSGSPVATIQVVDLKTHRVTDAGHLPEPLTASAAVVLGPDILLAGGDTAPAGGSSAATTSVSTVWFFNPAGETATVVGQLPVAESHAGVAVLGSTVWLVGGQSDGTPVATVQSLVTAAPPVSPTSS